MNIGTDPVRIKYIFLIILHLDCSNLVLHGCSSRKRWNDERAETQNTQNETQNKKRIIQKAKDCAETLRHTIRQFRYPRVFEYYAY